MKINDRKEFNEFVKGKRFVVEFIKKDGSQRKMVATTSFDFIPIEKHPKPKELTAEEIQIIKEKEESSPYINVFDVEVGDWRKVNLQTIIDVDVIIEKVVPKPVESIGETKEM